MKVKTIEDEEKNKRQFELYCKEVEKRFKNSKIKEYKFPKAETNAGIKSHSKSRNQENVAEKFIKLTELFEILKTQRNVNVLDLTSSIDTKSTNKSTLTKKTFENKKEKPMRNISKIFQKKSNLKHSASSGSFSKIKAFEKSILKQNREKYGRKYMIERKKINLQSKERDSSQSTLNLEQKLRDSKSRHKRTSTKKLNNSHLMKTSRSTRNLNPQSKLRRTMSGLISQFKPHLQKSTRNFPEISQSLESKSFAKTKEPVTSKGHIPKKSQIVSKYF